MTGIREVVSIVNGMSIPPLVMASIDAYVGVHHLAIYSHLRRSRQHLTFALLAFAVAGYCLCAAGLYDAASPEQGRNWMLGEVACLIVSAPAMMWFFADYTGTAYRRFVHLVTAGFVVVAGVAVVGGSTWICSHVPAVKHVDLPMGLSVTYQEVSSGPLLTALAVLALCVFALGFAGAMALGRRGDRRRAIRLGIATACFFVGFANDSMVAMGAIESIYTLEYAFLGFVVLMADGLVSDLARSAATEQALRESEEHFRSLAETTGLGILMVQNETYTYANPAAERITGYTSAELAGMPFWDLVHPDFRELVRSRASARLAGERGLPTHYEIKGSIKGGKERWFALTSGATTLGGRPALVVSINDITEARRLREEQAAIYEISEAAQREGTLDDLYRSIHAVISRLMPARNFYIALHDPVTNLLSFPYFVDEVDTAPEPFPLGRGRTSYVVRSGRPLLATPEVLADLESRGELEPLGAPSIDWLGVPLKGKTAIIGVLAVQSYAGNVRYGEAEKEVLSYISAQVAQAIERKKAEEALREDEERFRGAFDGAASGMALVGPDGHWLKVNRALCEIVGYPERELLTKSFQDITHPEDVGHDVEHMHKLLAGEISAYRVEKRYVHKDGHVVWIFLSVSVVRDGAGRPLYFVSHIHDLTERKKLEEQLLQAQKMEAVGRLAGGVAHDFNNVLQSMLSHVQLLRAFGADPGRVASVGAEVEQQIRRASALTRQLLVFSRQESARPEQLDLNAVVEQASAMLRPLVREDIALSLQLGESGLVVEADRGQLDQVLVNLVVNASDAISAGGAITLRTGREGDHVWVEVEDTGHGIPAEVLPRIFEPFFTTKAIGHGTGLGLAVVHGIVTAHRGHVEVRSEAGAGTTVRVLLPPALPGARPSPPPAQDLGEVPRGAGERVLVVEDEEGARKALGEMLTMLGYRVTTCSSAEEASRLPAEPRFDLLLTDLILPGAHGGDLARSLIRRWPELAIIVMSGYTNDEAIRRGVTEGKVRFLQKPFDMGNVAREIRAALSPSA